MADAVINLTPGAISKISTGKCTENDDLKPVVQVTYIHSVTRSLNGKQWYVVGLSDGSFKEIGGLIVEEIFISNKLQIGDILQLTKFQLAKFQFTKPLTTDKAEIASNKSYIRVCGLNLLRSKCDIVGAPKQYRLNETPLVERTALITRGKDDHANSHHVEEPLTSIQNHKTMAAVNLTPGAISKISTGKCTEEDDLKPVLQVIYINSSPTHKIDNKQWYLVGLSDGSFQKIGLIPYDIYISNKLKKGDIVQLTKFQLAKCQFTKHSATNKGGEIVSNISYIRVCGLNLLRSKCDIIGAPKIYRLNETHLVERTAVITRGKDDHANSHHVEEPPTSIQNHKTMAAVNLTPGAISNISTGKCTEEDDLKPVLQVINIIVSRVHTMHNKRWYWVALSDGSFCQIGGIAEEIFISNKLQRGSIVQLTKFQLSKFQLTKPLTTSKGEILSKSGILCSDLTVIHTKSDIIGDPNLILDDESPLVERTTPTVPDEDRANSKLKQDHVDSLLNEDIDDVEEPPTSKQNPSTSTQQCSSHSPTQNNKRKLQSSDDAISVFGKDTSDVMKMTLEKTIEDGLGPCYKKLATLEEDVSKMKKMMMEKNKEDDVGACFKKLETLEQDLSKMARMMMEKNKEDDMGACIEKLDKMKWEAQDPMYDTAVLLFGQSADYRKLWLHLKPESCGNWVKNAGSMFGLLD